MATCPIKSEHMKLLTIKISYDKSLACELRQNEETCRVKEEHEYTKREIRLSVASLLSIKFLGRKQLCPQQ